MKKHIAHKYTLKDLIFTAKGFNPNLVIETSNLYKIGRSLLNNNHTSVRLKKLKKNII